MTRQWDALPKDVKEARLLYTLKTIEHTGNIVNGAVRKADPTFTDPVGPKTFLQCDQRPSPRPRSHHRGPNHDNE
jgi:hypothetical protein